MDGLSEGAQSLEALLLADEPDRAVWWDEPEDLSRRSFEQFALAEGIVKLLRSNGRIRLTGAGVEGHSAALDAVASVMTGVQRLFTCVGASLRDYRHLTGQVPEAIRGLTQMRLAASPTLGSVVLDFFPEGEPQAELAPNDQLTMADDADQLVDQTAGEVVRVLDAIHQIGPDEDGSVFLADLGALGPRSAAALRELARTLAAARLDTELQWMQPNEPTLRVTVSAIDAERIARVVKSRRLDAETVEITGELHSKSDVALIHVEPEDGQIVAIKAGSITREMQHGIELGDTVKVVAELVVHLKPGVGDSRTYTGVSIERLP